MLDEITILFLHRSMRQETTEINHINSYKDALVKLTNNGGIKSVLQLPYIIIKLINNMENFNPHTHIPLNRCRTQ